MVTIFGVKFRSSLKILYFNINEKGCKKGCSVICKTQNGFEFGKVVTTKKVVSVIFGKNGNCCEGFVRLAGPADEKQHAKNLEFEKIAMKAGKEGVKSYGLAMKLILVVRTFDRRKLMFFFTAVGRVDFRKLVRYLAAIFKVRVELLQIGIRDEAKILSGIGMCGRVFCCSSYLDDFNHVSIKMAKVQNLSLNPRKISGCCGRLMCCLQHEQRAYEFLNSKSPKVGESVLTPLGRGVVVSRNLLLGEFKVKMDESTNLVTKVFNLKDIEKIVATT